MAHAGHATGEGRWWLSLRYAPSVGVLALGHTARDALLDAGARDPEHFASVQLGDVWFRLIDESRLEPRRPARKSAPKSWKPSPGQLRALQRIDAWRTERAAEANRQFLADTQRLANAIITGAPFWGQA